MKYFSYTCDPVIGNNVNDRFANRLNNIIIRFAHKTQYFRLGPWIDDIESRVSKLEEANKPSTINGAIMDAEETLNQKRKASDEARKTYIEANKVYRKALINIRNLKGEQE